jgi:hypothetical protein
VPETVNCSDFNVVLKIQLCQLFRTMWSDTFSHRFIYKCKQHKEFVQLAVVRKKHFCNLTWALNVNVVIH